MHSTWFSWGGDVNIRCGGGQPWFQLERTDYPQGMPISDLTYQLRTAAEGRPLLEVKERFRMLDYMCDIYYVTSAGARVPAVKVHREWQFGMFKETYIITALSKAVKDRFHCSGHSSNLIIQVNGRRAAVIQRHMFSLTDGYTLQISPNQDCLLLLGICCTIDRIHAAIDRSNSSTAA
jgi:uncharacterized protein YxjI